MKSFMLKLFCFMLIVSTALFIGTACKNEDGNIHTHTYEETWSYDSTHHYKKATCEHVSEVKDKGVHSMNGNACTVCDYTAESIGLEYALSEDGLSYYVKGIGVCTDTHIVIPLIYDNKPVTSIGGWAFMNCTNLTSVTIGNCVESIGYSAFMNCTNLTSVTIPNSVTSIGGHAFESCNKLVEVINKSPYITVTKGSNSNGYLGCYAVSIFNSDDTYVNRFTTDTNGFVIYTNGNDKVLVNYVGTNTNITIPSDITEIHKYAFYENKNITSVTIPNSVTSIGEYAFNYCSNLTSVTIGNSVTSIGNAAFSGCTSLTSITIPNSVTSIGEYAFYNCTNLTSITYNGTKSKWNSISKGLYWNDYVPATYVTCTDGTVSIEN